MAKTQKYSEDQLLEAVIKFSEVEKKKIKATELAKWCRNNIEGLEEVRDYHFTRSMKRKNEKTGKIIERPKLCTLKIAEINKSRSLNVSISTNLLLRASNIDTFMELSDSAKRKMIVETRETVDKIMNRNRILIRENEALKSENKSVKSDILILEDKIENLQKAQNKMIKQIAYLMKVTDEDARKDALSQMGVTDYTIDLDTYMSGLQQKLSEIMDIDQSLGKYLSETDEILVSKEKTTNLVENIMSGLDFK